MASAWLLTDGSAGMLAQARALAESLGLAHEAKKIALNRWFSWQPNAIYAAGYKHLIMDYVLDKKNSDALGEPWPPLVISCGRRAALIAMGMRHQLSTQQTAVNTRFIHIQDPQCPPENFDLVIAMEHDKVRGTNVITTSRALHNITPEKLEAARAQFAARFAGYASPKVAVLLGGSTNKYTLKPSAMKKIISSLEQLLAKTTCSLLITPSRRTGEENIRLLDSSFRRKPESSANKNMDPGLRRDDTRIYLYDNKEENPYLGLLALADYIIVTNDSVNMMSEALATGKPVYILPLPGHQHTKPARFAEKLVSDGTCRLLGESLQPWDYEMHEWMAELTEKVRSVLPDLLR
jgi:mitochondrial fission protein ELM1